MLEFRRRSLGWHRWNLGPDSPGFPASARHTHNLITNPCPGLSEVVLPPSITTSCDTIISNQAEANMAEGPDRGPLIVGVVWSLLILSGAFLSARLFAKRSRNVRLWWDDWVLIFAWVSLTISMLGLFRGLTDRSDYTSTTSRHHSIRADPWLWQACRGY
jgi:hypothetical protein